MDQKIRHLVIASLFAALICVATMVITIPLPGKGYLNTGDGFVLLSACMMGCLYGSASGAVGSALADVLIGYGIYAPGTFIIKGLMALTTALLYRALHRLKALPRVLLSALAGEVVMIIGYFLYELALFGWAAAIGGVPGNCVQAAGGVILTGLIVSLLARNEYVRRVFPHLD